MNENVEPGSLHCQIVGFNGRPCPSMPSFLVPASLLPKEIRAHFHGVGVLASVRLTMNEPAAPPRTYLNGPGHSER